jgi:hypothetical protein
MYTGVPDKKPKPDMLVGRFPPTSSPRDPGVWWPQRGGDTL